MKIKGNTILITGGTAGIGLGFAEEFFKEGNTVIITGRRAERLEAIAAKYPGIITKVSDIADDAQRVELAEWVQENYPETNILMNNAGVQYVIDVKTPVDLAKVRSEMETNFTAPLHLSSLFVSCLQGKKDAAIINITSGLAFVPIAMMPVYSASKAAMHSLCLSQRYQLKDTGIAVFEIAPPPVDTELGHDRREDKTKSHGGIPVSEFIAGSMEAIKNDVYEAAIGNAIGLREKREAIFETLNDRVVLI